MLSHHCGLSTQDVSAEPIVLVAAADEAYALPLTVTLFSALRTLRTGVPVEVHVLDGGIEEASRARIERTLSHIRGDLRLRWMQPGTLSLAEVPTFHHLSEAAYFRLLLPELLDAPRALYLDSDLLVVGDLMSVWTADLEGRPVAAVRDAAMPTIAESRIDWRTQGLDPTAAYFNSGLLLMDLEQWRVERLGEAVIEYAQTERDSQFPDQDGLNAVLNGRWTALGPEWNVLVTTPEGRAHPAFGRFSVAHFVGRRKPWRWRPLGPPLDKPFSQWYGALWECGWYGAWGRSRFMGAVWARTLVQYLHDSKNKVRAGARRSKRLIIDGPAG